MTIAINNTQGFFISLFGYKRTSAVKSTNELVVLFFTKHRRLWRYSTTESVIHQHSSPPSHLRVSRTSIAITARIRPLLLQLALQSHVQPTQICTLPARVRARVERQLFVPAQEHTGDQVFGRHCARPHELATLIEQRLLEQLRVEAEVLQCLLAQRHGAFGVHEAFGFHALHHSLEQSMHFRGALAQHGATAAVRAMMFSRLGRFVCIRCI